MGILSTEPHEFWATVSGSTYDELIRQQDEVWRWGVTAVEIRADLIPADVFKQVMEAASDWAGPTFVAHFGVGAEAEAARTSILRALEARVAGGICHSRCELAQEIQYACRAAGAEFAAAYHSQQPMTQQEAYQEFAAQEERGPLFRKIAVRAHQFDDAVALLSATSAAAQAGGSPLVSAVFGPHRWARVALVHAGSAITFLVAHAVPNECGGDDEQLSLAEAETLQGIRGLFREPGHSRQRVSGYVSDGVLTP